MTMAQGSGKIKRTRKLGTEIGDLRQVPCLRGLRVPSVQDQASQWPESAPVATFL